MQYCIGYYNNIYTIFLYNMYLTLLYYISGKMATPGGRSLEVAAEVEGLSTNSHLEGEDGGEFLASTASDKSKFDRFGGLFRRRKKGKDEGEDKEESESKNRPYGEMACKPNRYHKWQCLVLLNLVYCCIYRNINSVFDHCASFGSLGMHSSAFHYRVLLSYDVQL